MVTAVIIQARLGSSRLPAKVLLPLPTGRTVLEEVLHRCKQIPGVDVVVAAIPDTAENDILESQIRDWIEYDSGDEPLYCYLVRGPESDVLARYAKAAEAVNATHILRITSDCPLLDPEVCGDLLSLREKTNAGYASNSWPARHFPHGFDCEVFTREVLVRANETVPVTDTRPGGITWLDKDFHDTLRALETWASDREHCTPWMQRQPDIEKAFLKAMQDRSHLRWTLDTLEDYHRIWKVFESREDNRLLSVPDSFEMDVFDGSVPE